MLLNLGHENYLLTAAHIVDENKNTSLYVGTGNELELIEGEFFITREPEGGRNNDHYDFAWTKLSTDFLSKLERVKFIYEKDFAINLGNHYERLFLALGYPNSKNKNVNVPNKSVKPKFQKYSSIVKPNNDLCQKLGVSGNEHLFFEFDSKHSRNSDGAIGNSIEPRGMSGGAIIDMGRIGLKQLVPGTPCQGKLAGMLIENHKDHKTILVIKIGVIIKKIKNCVNDLSIV
jgi:hypothetical protein